MTGVTHSLQRSWGRSQSKGSIRMEVCMVKISLVMYLGWERQILEGIVILKGGEASQQACARVLPHMPLTALNDTCCGLWLWRADNLDRKVGPTCQWDHQPWRNTCAKPKKQGHAARGAAEGPVQPHTKTPRGHYRGPRSHWGCIPQCSLEREEEGSECGCRQVNEAFFRLRALYQSRIANSQDFFIQPCC